MPEPASIEHIGKRVRRIRRSRGMSQIVLGGLVGRSRAWVQQVERGTLPVDRVSVIVKLAEALNVPAGLLLGQPFLLRDAEGLAKAGTPAIRRALLTIPGQEPEDVPVRPLDALRDDLWHARDLRTAAHYLDLAARLPTLLTEAQAAVRHHRGEQAAVASGLLAHACQLASGLLHRLGEADLAFVAATLGLTAAERADDRLLVPSGARHLANVLLTSGRLDDACRVALDHAGRLDHALDRAPKPQVSLYGLLQLKAAVASARLTDRARTRVFLGEAGRAATLLGEDRNDYWSAFGPTNVAIHRVQVAVELGDAGHALELAPTVRVDRLPEGLLERRASHLIDVARALSMRGEGDEAVRQLQFARMLAPEELRYQPMARNLVINLLESQRRVSPALRRLADHTGAVNDDG